MNKQRKRIQEGMERNRIEWKEAGNNRRHGKEWKEPGKN